MRTKTWTVVSTKMDKTVVIQVDSYKIHPKYNKKYKTSTKFYAHDENNICKEGETITIKESIPLSKLKRWVIA